MADVKIRFKHQGFQSDAVKAVCDVFSGQIRSDRTFQSDMGSGTLALNMLGYGNAQITLSDDQIKANLREVQKQQGIVASGSLQKLNGTPVFTVEMETGTGKTYTYIKTMYELNAQYGWCKFIVVVPSIAIREGVNKSFESTAEHFAEEYGKKIRFFIYNSDKLDKLQQFSDDSGINVMIINKQAFGRDIDENAKNKVSLKIFDTPDTFNSRRPIDVVAATHPIVIIDEPQSVLGTDDRTNKTRNNIKLFDPLFLINYSATHREDFNKVYRLDAVDAYQQHLVKKIAVKGITVSGTTATNGYLYVQRINVYPNKKPDATVMFEFESRSNSGIIRKVKKLERGDDIYEQSGEIEAYRNNYKIVEINARDGYVEFSGGFKLAEGEIRGNTNENDLRRIQIRETILSHLAKERELYKKGIKVLSLFFIDEVAKYKYYDESGIEQKGIYQEMFEEEYEKAIEQFMETLPFGEDEGYRAFLNSLNGRRIHNGYFSIDKKTGHAKDSELKRGETASDDVDAYDLIMKQKERLLSFDEPTRFIFSHSALREGWDNPNVFQICMLRETTNDVGRRQEIGRGLRLCVDKDGNRMDSEVLGQKSVHDVNVLTVVASEKYEDFAKALQDEFAEVIKNRPRCVTPDLFIGQTLIDDGGQEITADSSMAAEIFVSLKKDGIIDNDGNLTDTFYDASDDLKRQLVSTAIGEDMAKYSDSVIRMLNYVYDPKRNPIVTNERGKAICNLRPEKYASQAFKELWKRINEKTYYTVSFEDEDIIKRSIDSIDKSLNVTQTHVTVTSGYLKESGLDSLEMQKQIGKDIILEEVANSQVPYDLIGELTRQTKLTRETIAKILMGISPIKFDLFKRNPEEFIHVAVKLINEQKAATVIEHITYDKIGEQWNAEEIFVDNEIKGLYDKNIIDTPNHNLYDKLRYDSTNELNFANELEQRENVDLYVKLPSGFYIETPMGKYNPDWAIAFKEGSVKHVYFVAETKGDSMQQSLRGTEEAKIECARKHFASISSDTVKYDVVASYEELYRLVTS